MARGAGVQRAKPSARFVPSLSTRRLALGTLTAAMHVLKWLAVKEGRKMWRRFDLQKLINVRNPCIYPILVQLASFSPFRLVHSGGCTGSP